MSKKSREFADRCKEESDYIALEMAVWRKGMGITQQEMADEIGVSRVYINQIENGKCKIPVYIFKRYCEILNVSPDVMMHPWMSGAGSLKDEAVLEEFHKLPDLMKCNIVGMMKTINS